MCTLKDIVRSVKKERAGYDAACLKSIDPVMVLCLTALPWENMFAN